jgi:hypothetical protein
MAEAAGILLRAYITEAELAAFFRRQVDYGEGRASVGHVLSALLDRDEFGCDILIVHHDPDYDRLFLAWIVNRLGEDDLELIWPVLEALAKHLYPTVPAKGAVASILPKCFESLLIQNGNVVLGPAELVSQKELRSLSDQLWSFARNGEFPDPARAMRRRNYHCKPFRQAWKAYRKWRDEVDRPARIAAATEAEPYRLVHRVYCWDGKVVERDDFTGRDIPFPEADPLTFRSAGGFYADKNHVWVRRLAENSPPLTVETPDGIVNNRAAIWEYRILPGIAGADFTWFDSRWDTTLWTDKRRIYTWSDRKLVALPDVVASEFRTYGQCFGTDGKAVFCGARKLPLNVERMRTEGGFVWDDEKVFIAGTELPLHGKTFRILGEKRERDGLYYRLADAEKTIVLGPGRKCLPDGPPF